MQNQLTVAQLITILQALPNQNALVDIFIREYQCPVIAEDIHVWSEELVIIGE